MSSYYEQAKASLEQMKADVAKTMAAAVEKGKDMTQEELVQADIKAHEYWIENDLKAGESLVNPDIWTEIRGGQHMGEEKLYIVEVSVAEVATEQRNYVLSAKSVEELYAEFARRNPTAYCLRVREKELIRV